MADRVIQRNDTAARWQSINPVLATGEIGIEIDGAKGYKIGDGKTRWNDLPYPANPTSVVQDLGNNENAVPSQKLVTEKLSELGSEVERLDVLTDLQNDGIKNVKIKFYNNTLWNHTQNKREKVDYNFCSSEFIDITEYNVIYFEGGYTNNVDKTSIALYGDGNYISEGDIYVNSVEKGYIPLNQLGDFKKLEIVINERMSNAENCKLVGYRYDKHNSYNSVRLLNDAIYKFDEKALSNVTIFRCYAIIENGILKFRDNGLFNLAVIPKITKQGNFFAYTSSLNISTLVELDKNFNVLNNVITNIQGRKYIEFNSETEYILYSYAENPYFEFVDEKKVCTLDEIVCKDIDSSSFKYYSWWDFSTHKIESSGDYRYMTSGLIDVTDYEYVIVTDSTTISSNRAGIVLYVDGNVVEIPTSEKIIIDIKAYNAKIVQIAVNAKMDNSPIIRCWRGMDAVKDNLAKLSNMKERGGITAYAHKGLSSVAPENTIPAFAYAAKEGFIWTELDVFFTSDGIPVVIHNPDIRECGRNADGSEITGLESYNVQNLTYNQLRTYDFGIFKGEQWKGTKIPSFVEALAAVKKLGCKALIELKYENYNQIKALVEIVQRNGMLSNVQWSATNNKFLYIVSHIDRNAIVQNDILYNNISEDVIRDTVTLMTGYNDSVITMRYELVDDNIQLAISNNIAVEVYTVNKESDILNLHPYISGVLSDSLNAESVLKKSVIDIIPT